MIKRCLRKTQSVQTNILNKVHRTSAFVKSIYLQSHVPHLRNFECGYDCERAKKNIKILIIIDQYCQLAMSYEWSFETLIGSGANGSAYLACRLDCITERVEHPDEKYVIKKVKCVSV